jgi:hypothetical protein
LAGVWGTVTMKCWRGAGRVSREKPENAEQAAAPTKGPLRKVPVNRPESSKVKEIVIQV